MISHEFKNLITNKFIKVLTSDFFIKNWNTAVNLCIWYRPKEYNDNILNFISNCRFKLIVLNNLIINSKEASNIYKAYFKHSAVSSLTRKNVRVRGQISACVVFIFCEVLTGSDHTNVGSQIVTQFRQG